MLGKLINQRYKIESELGQGGMGTVYKAEDSTLKRHVAVKIMSSNRLGTDGRARLMREAQVIANLKHPNIVTVYDAGEFEDSPFIVMEYVEGKTLDKVIVEDIDDVLSFAKQICAALDHAHQHDIIHRDLKPENILVQPDGLVRLMDFGLARSVSSRLTTEGSIVGTVFYMAPEQAMGAEVNPQSDLYSFGVLLYEMLTGVLPFEAEEAIAVLTQHIHSPIVPPRAKNENIPDFLNNLVLQLMSKAPNDRPESAAVVLKILENPETSELKPSEEVRVLDRIVRGRMIGRSKEMEEARSIWKEVASGNGQIVMISGEPGIGKSRMIREFMTHSEVSGGRPLLGASYAEGGAPYSAFGQIGRKVLGDSKSPISPFPDYIVSDLLSIAPDLKPLYPNIPPNPALEPQFEQQRLFESVTTFFNILAENSPLLLVLEDVHWADSGSLFLMRHLARYIQDSRILIAATYREVEIDENLPFKEVLNDLNRERLATRLKLQRLTKDQTSNLLTTILAEEISPDFLDGIYSETEGNPFFIEEVCKALVDSGKLYFENGKWHRPAIEDLEIPQSIRVAIQERVSKMSEEHQATMRLAANIGHEFDYKLLTEASTQDEDTIIDALEFGENAQLIRDISVKGVVRYAFMHALIPFTLSESLNILRRQRIHLRIAEAIEKLHPEDYESLAHHFTEAGKLNEAVDNYRSAAVRAQELFTFEASISNLESALELIEPGENVHLQIEILEQLGDLLLHFGENIKAIEQYKIAIDLVDNKVELDPIILLRLHRKIVKSYNQSVWFEDRQEMKEDKDESIQVGLNLVKELDSHPEVSLFYSFLSIVTLTHQVTKDYQLAEKYALLGKEAAINIDNAYVLSVSLGALSSVQNGLKDFHRYLEVCEERSEIVNQDDFEEISEKIDANFQYAVALIGIGKYQKSIPYLEVSEKLSADINDLRYQIMSMIYQSRCNFYLDRWDRVLEIELEWRDLKENHPNFINRSGALCGQIGRAAAVHALRGDMQTAVALRQESNDIMLRSSGPSENWTAGEYI